MTAPPVAITAGSWWRWVFAGGVVAYSRSQADRPLNLPAVSCSEVSDER